MSANSFTIVSNDTRATRVTGMARHEMQEAQAGADTDDKIIEDERGGVCAFGRGTSNRNITYFAFYNENAELVYGYPNAAGNGYVFTTVKP